METSTFREFSKRRNVRDSRIEELEPAVRDDRWSEAIAVGSLAFVETVKNDLGVKAIHREVLPADGTYALREASEPYVRKFTGKNEVLRAENTIYWDENAETADTWRGPTRMYFKSLGVQPRVR